MRRHVAALHAVDVPYANGGHVPAVRRVCVGFQYFAFVLRRKSEQAGNQGNARRPGNGVAAGLADRRCIISSHRRSPSQEWCQGQ